MKSLFVGNISFRTTENELRSIFEPFGEIARVRLVMDQYSGRSRGFGFVEMVRDEQATEAMLALNGKEVDGRPLNVTEARPRPARAGSQGDTGTRERYAGNQYRRTRY